MANPQMVMQLSKDFIKRNNPAESMVKSITSFMDFWLNFNSRTKIMKYKFLLMQQQMNRMDQQLNQGSPYAIRGTKLNKNY